VRDLERATAAETGATIFVILDLDGFKAYNDRFGHPAGDKLLRRLGASLAAAVSREGGTAYRLGGDEFCALVPGGEAQVPGVLLMTAKALGDRGAGFEIAASSGAAVVPAEARDPSAAMRIADIRMYAEKSTRSTGAGRRGDDVLVGAPPDAGSVPADKHHAGGEHLAVAIGRTLAFDRADLEVLGRAAELHDIGKAAIPERILDKHGPLEPDEWELIRSHTTIGQRIVAGTPGMTAVAELLRSTHERWDGDGYPDGLLREQIPLGSRVIFVCDAFEAMTENRPYRVAVSDEEALLEVLVGAGTQFDPDVVNALVEVQAALI
jgi:diguanylate cyclase (GGDEF)-like protein